MVSGRGNPLCRAGWSELAAAATAAALAVPVHLPQLRVGLANQHLHQPHHTVPPCTVPCTAPSPLRYCWGSSSRAVMKASNTRLRSPSGSPPSTCSKMLTMPSAVTCSRTQQAQQGQQGRQQQS